MKRYESTGVAMPPSGRHIHQLMGGVATLLLLFLLSSAEVQAECVVNGFDPNPDGAVKVVVIQPGGKILIGGGFMTVSPNGGAPVVRNGLARLNPDGTLDTAFDCETNCNANGEIDSIAIQADGKVLIAGGFSTVGGQTRNGIARLDGTTGLVDSFDPNADGSVNSIAVQADGKVLAGGDFTNVGGQPRNYMARLDATTGLADSFDPNASGTVWSIAVQANGKILAGGGFSSIGGQPRSRLARLDAVTGLADSFDPNVTGTQAMILTIAVQGDGKILVGGNFSSIGGQMRRRIGRLDATTGLADSFDPNVSSASSFVWSLAVQVDGKILAGGFFFTVGGQSRSCLARLEAATGLVDSFDPNANTLVSSVVVRPDGKILAGGGFTSIAGQTRNYHAELFPDCALPTPTPTPTITATPGTPTPTSTATSTSTASATATPTATATSAASATATPTATATSTASATATPTATATATASATASPTATATSTASATAAPTLTPSPPPTATATPTTTPTPTITPSILGNISTRLRVEMDNNVLIGGFIVTGAQPKKVMIRAIGPSLSAFFPGALTDPVLELRDSSGGLLRSNDNWHSDQEAEIIATGIPPSNDLESAIVAMLPASNSAYTAVVRGVNNGTGIGVVEVYDLDQTVDSKLANISTRGLVQTGNNVLIGGLIVLGQDPLRVIVRAIGPSLPIPSALGDPTLELHDGNGALIASNDNWRNDQEAEIIATGIQPSNDLESAIVRDLSPGSYTAIVRGVNAAVGVALVEAYGLN